MTEMPKTPADILLENLRKWREGHTTDAKEAGEEPRRRNIPRRTKIVLWILAIIIAVVILAFILSSFWSEILWFDEVGYRGIFLTRIWAPLALGVVAGIVFFAVFYLNLRLARRLSPRLRVAARNQDDEGTEILELIPTPDRSVNRILLIGSMVVALFFAVGTAGGWQEILLFFNRVDFGYTDPIFNRDASFYVYVLPILRRLLGFFSSLLIVTLIATTSVYVFDRAITRPATGRGFILAPHVKAHLSLLAALILVGKAVEFFIQRWELLYSTRGVTFGAGYTDATVQLPVLGVLAAVALISAVIFLVNIHYRGWKLPIVSVGLLVVVWVGAGAIYPAIIQQYRVSPNEIQMETPYIVNNIEATRFAFGLDNTITKPFPAKQQLTLEDIENNKATIDNIRLWDPRPLLDTYSQLQEIRLYYRFKDVDVDRYHVDDNYRQVMLAARELDQSDLQAQAKTWVNERITYTHGYGVVACAVNEVRGEGLPAFLIEDIPPQTKTDLSVTRPEIYYGEIGNEFVLVKTTALEFDYPSGNENVFTTYEGEGGVPITGFFKQLAFTIKFRDLKLLFSEYLTPETRIMYKRTIRERVQAIAPFLQYDRDPYIVIRDDGSLVWIMDVYTTTGRFPYAQPTGQDLNYIRNSIKVVIDAYHGDVTFYQIDPDDAMATAWSNVFPELLRPGSELPDDLRQHLRYPEDMFSIQADKMTVYHMQDPQTFYNKEDVWQIPEEIYFNEEVRVEPYYIIMGLPGEREEEFILLQPFTPLERKNMIAWMCGRMDGDNYGQIVIFDFPKDTLIFGPSQVEARITNDTEISAQITLWSQAGSRVIRGNLLVIPVEDSVMYVEPLFLQAEQSPIPELRRVIVNYGDEVVMEPTLADGLKRIFGSSPPSTTEPPSTTTTEPTETTITTAPPTTTSTTAGLPADAAELIARAEELYQQILTNQGETQQLINELGRVLDDLARIRQ
ncbi:MAG: UPF0182 family protein [Actinobacteria bacterium]|nr:UPF0182 family protein [Actinomycetota bacterium]